LWIFVSKTGVIEVTFHEDSDGFISLVGRPLTRPRTNSLASSKIHDDMSSCIAAAAAAGTTSEFPLEEKPTDPSSAGHNCHDVAAAHGHRFVYVNFNLISPLRVIPSSSVRLARRLSLSFHLQLAKNVSQDHLTDSLIRFNLTEVCLHVKLPVSG